MDRWAKEFDCCVKCGSNEKKHRAFGLCRYCFEQEKRKLSRGEDSLCYPMKEGQWAKKFDCCKECSRTDRGHVGNGLCGACTSHLRKVARGLQKVYKREHKTINEIECKYCPMCDSWMSLDRFLQMSSKRKHATADGLECYCKTCRWKYNNKVSKTLKKQHKHNNDIQRKRSDERKFGLLDKQGGGCYVCKKRYSSARVYDLHHLDRKTKEHQLSRILIRANTDWESEAQKCIVVCATCHRLVEDMGIEKAMEEVRRVFDEDRISCS